MDEITEDNIQEQSLSSLRKLRKKAQQERDTYKVSLETLQYKQSEVNTKIKGICNSDNCNEIFGFINDIILNNFKIFKYSYFSVFKNFFLAGRL